MVEIKKISKKFGDKVVFTDLSYTINDGKMIAIVGPSGCGKSTLLNIIGLLDTDYSGEVLYDGQLISKASEKKRDEYIRNNINYLFQNYALIETDTVEENLMLALEYEKLTKNEKIQKINNSLELVGLKDFNKKEVFTLSGGEQQRVALARIILKRGNIVLADEPTGNLDTRNSKHVMKLLEFYNKKYRQTIIMVTHDMSLAKRASRIITMSDGKIIRDEYNVRVKR